MKILNDKKVIALGVILVIFTIAYFVIAVKISYAFDNSYDANKSYDKTLEIIKQSALAYGKEKIKEFTKEKPYIYSSVQELIDNGYLVPNEDGNIVNPLKTNETLNSRQIIIEYENENFTVEVV